VRVAAPSDSEALQSRAEKEEQPAPSGVKPAGCGLRAVEFDFQAKHEGTVPQSRVAAAIAEGKFVWLDLEWSDAAAARSLLGELALLSDEVIEDALRTEPETRSARYEHYLHLVVTGCRLQGLHFEQERVDIVIAERFLITVHQGSPVFLQAVNKDYRADFLRFAKSPSFLVYELWDHLIENYLTIQTNFERRVEALQRELMKDVDDKVFEQVSELGADLLHFRKVLLPARTLLTDLSTRKSLFISEATQAFLGNMVGTVEHVLQELLVDREILSESLNLYMSIMGHRTNIVMKRLTGVSIIFLPLTFLVGVYGMNFEILPELRWQYGYYYFWGVVLALSVVLLVLLRRSKLL
jgi:magnesium transporter